MPAAATHEDEMSAETWFAVREGDIFPEEFRNFVMLPGVLGQAFLAQHAGLFQTEFWLSMQERQRAGEVVDFFPYPSGQTLFVQPLTPQLQTRSRPMILSLVSAPPAAPSSSSRPRRRPAPPPPPKPALAPSPIATLQVTPGTKVSMTAGDTLRLRAVALDAAGKPVDGVTYRYMRQGGRFEGKVDSTGLVESGSTGTLGVSVIASVPGPSPWSRESTCGWCPAPPPGSTWQPAVGRMVVGQRLRLTATSYSAASDQRSDKFTWRSSAPAVAKVGDDGVVTAVAPGKAVITAKTGTVDQKVTVQVIANTIASLELTPARSDAKTGDVIQFKVTARDRNGAGHSGLTPTWSFSPGNGLIDANGAFVGYEAGDVPRHRELRHPERRRRRHARRRATCAGR